MNSKVSFGRGSALFIAALICLAAPEAQAVVAGDPMLLFRQFRLFGDAAVTGNTLMVNTCPYVNTILLPQSSGEIAGTPRDAVLEGAYLFWSASRPTPDNTAVLVAANGALIPVTANGTCHQVSHVGGSYGCVADITAALAPHKTAQGYNGTYTVRDVQGTVGVVDENCNCVDWFCQARFAGWSLVLVYSGPSERVERDVFLYDGFRVIDEEYSTPGVDTFTISGFRVGSPPEAKLSFFALEGDWQLGIPYQDSMVGPAACPDQSCIDAVSFNGTKLSNAFNHPGNIFNGSVPGGYAVGVDLDTYDVSHLVSPGDTSATISLISGDGIENNNPWDTHGWGEYVIVNWLLLRLNRLAPNFSTNKTRLDVVPGEVAPGATVYFTLTVTNDGSMDATNVVVTDTMPAGMELIPGTTRIDGGAPLPGNPLLTGLNLGSIPHTGNNDKRVTYQARVLATTLPGTVLRNSAQINANELVSAIETNEVIVRVIGPDLNRPTKIYKDLNGGQPNPGDIIEYEIYLSKEGDIEVGGLVFKDTISPYVQLTEIPVGPYDTSQSSLNGGANGTGYIEVRGITISAQQPGIYLRYKVRILSTAELIAKGVAPENINGLAVSNQGRLEAPFLPAPLLTDDPTRPGPANRTVFVIRTGVDFSGVETRKEAVDSNGGQLLPGDTIAFAIVLTNKGTQPGTLNLVDDIPAWLENVTLQTAHPALSFLPAPAGANGTGRLLVSNLILPGGASLTIQFSAQVAAAAPDGTVIVNVAPLTVAEDPGQNRSLQSPPLTVFNRPSLAASTKTVVNQSGSGGYEPGDTVRYTLTVSNSGTLTANAVTISDPIDPGLENIVPENGGSYNAGAGVITWNLGNLAPGAVAAVHFRATIRATVANGTVIANQATLQGANTAAYVTDDPATPAPADPTRFVVEALPDLNTFTKVYTDENGGTVKPGDWILYTLQVSNNGRAVATNTVVTDVLDQAFVEVLPLDGGAFDGPTRTVRWNLGTLAVGESRSVRVRVRLAALLPFAVAVANQGRITAAELNAAVLSDDPATPAPRDPTVFVVDNAALVAVDKEVIDVNGGAFQPGDEVLYTLRVTNSGDAVATDVVITDPIDPHLVDVTPLDGGLYDASQGRIIWALTAALVPETPVLLRFSARIAATTPAGTVVANQATLTALGVSGSVLSNDPTTPAPLDPTRFTVERRPDFAGATKVVENLDGGTLYRPGDRIRYTLNFVNQGTAAATAITVTDVIDGRLQNLTLSGGGTLSGGTATWNVPTLAAGASLLLTIEGDIVSPLPDGTVIANQAFITSAEVSEAVGTDDPSTPAPNDPTRFSVLSQPDLSGMTKIYVDVNGGNVEPGDLIRYVITVTNTGSDVARNVVVRDRVDINLRDVFVQDGGTWSPVGRFVEWGPATNPALAEIGVGETVVLRFAARVVAPITNLTRIENQAFAEVVGLPPFPSDDPTTPEPGDPTAFFVVSAADLRGATKEVSPPGPDGYRPGDTLTYTIRLTNQGNDVARNVNVRDAVDANLTQIVPANGGVYNSSTREIRWNIGDVAVNATVTLSFTATIATPLASGTLIANQAFVRGPDIGTPLPTDDPRTPAVGDPTVISVTSAALYATSTKRVIDLDGDDIFEPGNQVRYELEIINDGDAPGQNVVVSDLVPAALTNVIVFNGGSIAGNVLTWTLPEVAAGQRVAVAFTATIAAGTPNGTVVENQATIVDAQGQSAVTDDPATPQVGDPTRFVVRAGPRLLSLKTVEDLNGGRVTGGDPLRYTILVRNAGTETATNLEIRDPIDPWLFDVNAFGPGLVSVSEQEVIWRLASLAPGDEVILEILAVVRPNVADGTRIANQAFIVADGGITLRSDDPATAEPEDPTVVVVNAEADLSTSTKVVTTSSSDSWLRPGDRVSYTIEVHNTGFAAAERVEVRDPIPAGLSNVQAQGATVVADTVVWNGVGVPALARIEPGERVRLTFTATIADGVLSGTVIANQAFIRADGVTETPSDDPATPAPADPTLVTVRYPSLARFTKTVEDLNGGSVRPGDQLRYQLTITAGEGETLRDLIVTDPVPPLVRIVSVGQGGRISPTGSLEWNAGTTPALGALEAQRTVSLDYTVQVPDDTPSGTEIVNQAVVSADGLPRRLSDDPSKPGPEDPTVVVVRLDQSPDLSLALKRAVSVSGGDFLPGDIILYDFEVTNRGMVASDLTRVFDAIPAATTYVANSTRLNGTAVPDNPQGLTPIVDGLLLNNPNTLPGVIQPDATVTFSFQVRILPGTPLGTLIINQARVVAAGGILELTDDPATPALKDPTVVVVGGGPAIGIPTKTVSYQDTNANGQLDVGERVTYRIEIPNLGREPLEQVSFIDPIPTGADYVPESMTLDGRPLTDAPDGDPGLLIERILIVAVPTIAAGQSAVITFSVIPTEEGLLSNQGEVAAASLPSRLTDDPTRPGTEDPTVIMVGEGEFAPLLTKAPPVDLNGDRVLMGDRLRYRISIENLSTNTIRDLTLTDPVPDALRNINLEVAPQAAIALEGNTLRVEGFSLAPGQLTEIVFSAEIVGQEQGGTAQYGVEFCNVAQLRSPVLFVESGPQDSCITPALVPEGYVEVIGVVAHDLNGDGVVQDDEPRLARYRVEAVPAVDGPSQPLAATESDGQGNYRLIVPATDFYLHTFSDAGTQMARTPWDGPLRGESAARFEVPIPIDPQGIVYDSKSGQPLSGVQIFVYYDDSDPIAPGDLVPAERLPGREQQGQVTSRDGFYQFFFEPMPERVYRLEIALGRNQPWQFPSVLVPALPGVLELGPTPIDVVPNGLPDVAGEQRYYLRFKVGRDAHERGAQNNHLPLDPVNALISIDKRVDKASASIGDVLTYRVTVQNRSDRDLILDVASPDEGIGGIYVEDLFPSGATLHFVESSARATVWLGTQEQKVDVVTLREEIEGRTRLRFGRRFGLGHKGIDLPAGARLELGYRAQVGVRAESHKTYTNVARVRGGNGMLLSDNDTAEVRIAPDPIFDQGLIFGKVFCDANGNGYQDQGEEGVYHARVMLDTGFYAMTDAFGKFHFQAVDPGSHQIKIDTASLPYGATMSTAESKVFYMTHGLPVKVNFGVFCPEATVVSDVQVELGDQAAQEALAALQQRFVPVKGDMAAWEVEVDGEKTALMRAELSLESELTASAVVDLQEGKLDPPLSLRLVQQQGPAPSLWRVVVAEAAGGKVVHEMRGRGMPPATLTWDGTSALNGRVLEGGKAYHLWLELMGGQQEFSRSAPVPLAIAGSSHSAADLWEMDAADGPLFDRKHVPTKRLKDALAEQVHRLRPPKDHKLVIEVHIDDELAPFEAFDLTLQQAEALERYLRQSALLEATASVEFRPRGSDDPFLPSFDEESRRANRRVVLQTLAPETSPVAEAPQTSGRRVLLNDFEAPFGDDTFDFLVPRPSDGVLVVDLREEDGRRAVRAFSVSAQQEVSAATSRLKVVPDARQVEWSQGQVARPTLPAIQTENLGPTLVRLGTAGLAQEVRVKVSVPQDAPVTAWAFTVRKHDTETVIYRTEGNGRPPGEIAWDGRTTALVESGPYVAQLMVRGEGLARAYGPEISLRVVEEDEVLTLWPPAVGAFTLRVNGRVVVEDAQGAYVQEVSGQVGDAVLVDVRENDGSRWVELVHLPDPASPAPQAPPAASAEQAPDAPLAPDGALDAPLPADDGSPQTAPSDSPYPLFEEPLTGHVLPDFSPATVRRSHGAVTARPADSYVLRDDAGWLPLRGHALGLAEPLHPPRFRLLGQVGDANLLGPNDLGPQDGAAESGEPLAEQDNGAALVQTLAPHFGAGQVDDSTALVSFGAQVLDAAFSADGLIDVQSLRAEAKAGRLQVALPPVDATLSRNALAVVGQTDPDNAISINGKVATVRSDGRFALVVDLPDGPSTLVIESRDPQGNVGRLEWPVRVATVEYFLMAFADTAIGGAKTRLAGAHGHNSTRTDSVLLYGQARLYFKGRMRGADLGFDFFDAYRATVHLDTGKRAEFEAMFDTLIKPEEYYPVFGDSSDEVHDANARGKLYLLVEADSSYLKVANFMTDLKGIEHFAYTHSLYGMDLSFDKTFADDYRTEARVFVAGDSFLGDGSARLRNTFNYLRGTGGSLYYLEQANVVEGSEQVTLVARDPFTGAEVARIPQTRNVDYVVRYREGRILFKSPVPSVADPGLLTGLRPQNTRDTSGGYPLFVEVSYAYESDKDGGGTTVGAQLRETLFGKLSLGTGYVQEGRGGALAGEDYQLFGIDLSYRHSQASFAEVEYARNRSFDALAALSDDGGLSYGAFQRRDGVNEIGNAFYAKGQLELADLIDTERAQILQISGFYSLADEGFYAHRSAMDRGYERFGGAIAWNIDEANTLAWRSDGVLTQIDDLINPQPGALRTVARYGNRLTYDYRDEAHRFGAEYGIAFYDDHYEADAYQLHTSVFNYTYTGIKDLSLGIGQEFVMIADDPRLIKEVSDRFTTQLTASWRIIEDLSVEAVQRLRWNGENSTRLGLRSEVGDGTTAYIQQRLGTQAGGKHLNTTTVVGGEQRFGEDSSGRAFGEYQLDGGISGRQNRAVAGIGKMWELARGVRLDTAYERTQIFGDQKQHDSARDVLSLGFELTRFERIKVGSRFEFRYDHGSARRPQGSPCLSNGIMDSPDFCRDLHLGGFDKYQVVTLNTVDWQFNDDLTFLVRYNLALTQNLTLSTLEQIDQEATFGLAFRPVTWDTFNLLVKYTYLDHQRPLALDGYTADRTEKHVVSLIPVFELSTGTQVVAKVAWKHVISDLNSLVGEELPTVITDTLLFILRINQEFYRLSQEVSLQVAGEYRFLQQFEPLSYEHGVLLETGVVLFDHLRIGVGYNFTSFTDDIYAPEGEDAHGWFFRVQGTY